MFVSWMCVESEVVTTIGELTMDMLVSCIVEMCVYAVVYREDERLRLKSICAKDMASHPANTENSIQHW